MDSTQFTHDEARFLLNALSQLSFTVKFGEELCALTTIVTNIKSKLESMVATSVEMPAVEGT